MTSKAYYGCEFLKYTDDASHKDFTELLAKKISFKPKLWNLVKYTFKDEAPTDGYTSKFYVIFNHVIDGDEFNEFIEPFNTLNVTEISGLEL